MFKGLLEDYRAGEYELKQYLKGNGFKVIDVSGNSAYWHKDIDLIATDASGITKTIEIKWDNRICQTGNLYIEYYNDCSKEHKGWINFTQADILAYGDSYNSVFYLFKMDDIKEYIFALITFVISISKIVANNTQAMTEVKVSLDDLKEALTENKLDVKQLRDNVNEHETRITILENIHE